MIREGGGGMSYFLKKSLFGKSQAKNCLFGYARKAVVKLQRLIS